MALITSYLLVLGAQKGVYGVSPGSIVHCLQVKHWTHSNSDTHSDTTPKSASHTMYTIPKACGCQSNTSPVTITSFPLLRFIPVHLFFSPSSIFPLSPQTSISTDRFSRTDYVVPFTHSFHHVLPCSTITRPLG